MSIGDRKTGNVMAVVVSAALLGGCALPVPVQIASWALDGISFLATEKSLTDHGISMVAQKDCALWRGLKGDQVCSDYDAADTVAIAAADAPLPDGHETREIAAVEEETPPVVESTPAKAEGQRLMIAGKRVWSDRLDADLYYVIGSFSKRSNAREMLDKHEDLGPAVMASRLDGVEVYRIAVGPFASEEKRALYLELKKAGINGAWAMRVNHGDWRLASRRELSDPVQAIAETPSGGVPSGEVAESPAEEGVMGPSSELRNGDGRYLVIGSFAKADNAKVLADRQASLSPRILSVDTAKGLRHRVVLGPYAKAEIPAVRRRAEENGIKQIWALQLDPGRIVGDSQLAAEPEPVLPVLNDQAGGSVDLVENIADMFRSPDEADPVGGMAPLEG